MNDYKDLINKAVEIAELTPPICVYEANNNGSVFCKPFEQFQSVLKDAADAIERLVADIDVVRKERDAAIEEITVYHYCRSCKHRGVSELSEPCHSCNQCWGGADKNNWEWCGVQDGNGSRP